MTASTDRAVALAVLGTDRPGAAESTGGAGSGVDRSAAALAIALADVAERVRTAPEESFAHCAVRGAWEVLRARVDARVDASPGAVRDEAEGS